MATGTEFDEMSGGDLLDQLGTLATTRRRTEVKILQAAAAWAALNNPDTLDPDQARLPGRESPRLYGGAGTPYVTSFAGAEFGARLGRSTWAGDQEIAAALDLQHRLRQLWTRVLDLEVEASYAKYVAKRTRDLPAEQAAYVDSRVAESADGRITWGQFTNLVDAAIVAADPETARAKEEAARRQRFARPTRSTEHGMRGFYLFTDVASITRLDATVAHLADAIGALGSDDDPADTPADTPSGIVADAIHLFRQDGDQPTLAWDQLLPRVTLHLHYYAGELTHANGDDSDGPGVRTTDPNGITRIEGLGAVTDTWARHTLGDRATFTIRPVFHPHDQAPVHAWEIPDRHRRAVSILTPADVFPFGSTVVDQTHGWRSMQIDHTEAWRPVVAEEPDEPRSRIGNYGPLSRFHHMVKTHGNWKVRQPFPGIYLWRDPHGATYLVDQTGTRRLRTPLSLDLVEYDAA